jgi:hypothetical protein
MTTAVAAAAAATPSSLGRRFVRATARGVRAAVAIVPTRRLVVVTALLALVWLLSGTPNGTAAAIFVTGLLVAAVALDVLTLPARWQLEIERAIPERIGLGDAASGRYVVRVAAGRALHVSLYDDLPRGVRSDDARFGVRVVRADTP